jgi:hypothetical protein
MEDKIKGATKIYYQLLKSGEIRRSLNKDLYNLYANYSDVQDTLKYMAEESKCDLLLTTDALYMIPKPENDIIGFNYKNDEDFKSVKDETDYYLGLYIITVIFNEFFNTISPMEFISVDELVKKVEKRMEAAALKDDVEEIENEFKYNIRNLKDAWFAKENIPGDKDERLGKQTWSYQYRYGCVRKMIIFLTNQGLVLYSKEDDEIRPTQKLNDLMNYYFLDNRRKAEIESIFFEGAKGDK